MVEVPESRSAFFQGMAGSRLPIAVAHGEGMAEFRNGSDLRGLREGNQVALRYADHYGRPTEHYPHNPNGSPEGVTGLCSEDGRTTIMMPHPERVFRSVQCSWHPDDWGEDGAWLRLFRNARKWVG
jgi:phosphoribosylformylglycinamidine synthase